MKGALGIFIQRVFADKMITVVLMNCFLASYFHQKVIHWKNLGMS